ncbi:hypothetical protein T484DRAFT_1841722 [Baffinella frigidus]|nr:hypothetical protein T484DRAFT_1841722 [Cryptophyta sp. CCMP2293]
MAVACTKFAILSPGGAAAAGGGGGAAGVGAVYVVSGDGVLTRFLLTPKTKPDPDAAPDALLLSTECQSQPP